MPDHRRTTIELTDKATVFRAETGPEIVYLTDTPYIDGHVLSTTDGRTYFALARTYFSGSAVEHDFSFRNPHDGHEGRWHRRYAELVLDGVTFKKAPAPREITLAPLPPARKPAYLFRLRDGRYIYVSVDAYNRHSDASFRLFIGDGETMREIPVTNITRYPDGGATCMETAEETLFSPAAVTRDDKPAWGQKVLEPLDPREFVISEYAAGATIRPAITVHAAKALLDTWHRREWNDGTNVWLKHPSDRDYAAIGEFGPAPYVQVWLPGRESVVFHADDARLLKRAGERGDETTSPGATA